MTKTSLKLVIFKCGNMNEYNSISVHVERSGDQSGLVGDRHSE